MSSISGLRFGSIFSAFAEANSIETLSLFNNEICRGPAYWSWLVYAFWSKASQTSVQTIDISQVHLTEELVSAAEQVSKTSYPQPSTDFAQCAYGHVDILEGTKLRFKGFESEREVTLIASRGCRCRAFYSGFGDNSVANVIVPGYGVCEVNLLDGVAEFTRDILAPNKRIATMRTRGVRSLNLTMANVENDTIVPRLLAVVGGQLHALVLDFRCDREIGLDLCAVASTCPELKGLLVRNCNVTLDGDQKALRSWRIRKLVIRGTHVVRNLSACLSNSTYRMSRKLLVLEVALIHPRYDALNWNDGPIEYRRTMARYMSFYVGSLMAHDNDDLGEDEEKFAKTRSALISVMSSRSSKLQAMKHLDSYMLGIILAFARTPDYRSVKVIQFSKRAHSRLQRLR